MGMIPVDSSNIALIGYDIGSGTLKIQFNNGRTYEYYDVPESAFINLMNASSKGKYADQNIYKVYSQSEV